MEVPRGKGRAGLHKRRYSDSGQINMPLTTAQKTALKADILADSTLSSQPNNSDGAHAIAAAYDVLATPAFWVWKTQVSKGDLTNTVGPEGTIFVWAGNGFITRTAQETTAWREIFDASGYVNASLQNVRQAFADIFSGTGNAALNRTHLLASARRQAARVEKLFATGTGSTAAPAILGFEGSLTIQDVQTARNS
jgi:hypothetical protein